MGGCGDGACGSVQSTSPEKSRGWFPRRLRSTEQKATLVLTSPEGSGEPPGLSVQGEKQQQEWGRCLWGRGRGCRAAATLTCTHVLLELVPHVHEFPQEGWPGKPLSPSGWRLYLTQVQRPLEPGGRQLPALLPFIRCGQQLCQVPPPRHCGPCQPAWTPEREELEAERLTKQ